MEIDLDAPAIAVSPSASALPVGSFAILPRFEPVKPDAIKPPETLVRVGGDVQSAKLIKQVVPAYPQPARQIRAAVPAAKILILTVHEIDHLAEDLVEAGARGYILKCASDDDIVRAVRGVAAGEAIFGQNIHNSASSMPTSTRCHQEIVAS